MRRMLDPKEAGLPSTITFDQEGNRTIGKNLGVDGKLKLKSLVSASNPDGDITKELGGGGSARHAYRILIDSYCWFLSFTEKDYGYKIGESTDIPTDFYTSDNYKELLYQGLHPAGGYYNGNEADMLASFVEIYTGGYNIGGYVVADKRNARFRLNIQSRIVKIIQLN